jgi:nucleoside-diphosphate-sugar epimerase
MTSVVVTGATGFIGRHLVRHLAASGARIRALTRGAPSPELSGLGVDWVVGDLRDSAAWEKLLTPGCTVFNLAYSAATVAADAVQTVDRLVTYCAAGRISRLVHGSTVSVYGRIGDPVVTEATNCHPWNRYGEVKLEVEKALIGKVADRFECVILRPSTVFGDGGLALTKAIEDQLGGSKVLSYLRASLFGGRRTHLVPVGTVVAALLHVARIPLTDTGEIFIASDDDEPINNFRDVEQVLREELNTSEFPIPPVVLPRELLESLLYVMNRPNVNTQVVFSAEKLVSRGFVRPVPFEHALRRFVRDYQSKNWTEGRR